MAERVLPANQAGPTTYSRPFEVHGAQGGVCHTRMLPCPWDEVWSHCTAPALLIPLRGEAEPSSWAVGSLPTLAQAVVSTHKHSCPLGHCNLTPILLAGCFEVPRLEMLSSVGTRDLPSAIPRIHPSMVGVSTPDCCLQLLEISSPWETQHFFSQGEGN